MLETLADLEKISRRLRRRVVEMSHFAKTPHLGSALSCIDILVAAYWTALNIDSKNPYDPNRDRFILSKGHAASALYSVLAEKGFFSIKDLNSGLISYKSSIIAEIKWPSLEETLPRKRWPESSMHNIS